MFKGISKQVIFLLVIICSGIAQADLVWIDVRSDAENKVENIKGDLHIPHQDIVDQVERLYPDKDTEINLYCRSGGRAGKALSALKEAGYNNVKNSGGIDDARVERSLSK